MHLKVEHAMMGGLGLHHCSEDEWKRDGSS